MALMYKFKKEKLRDGSFVARPKIPVILHGNENSVMVTALIDSGCDVSVISEDLAKAVGLSLDGEKDKLFGFRESNEVTHSKANLTFVGKEQRENVRLDHLPVLITTSSESSDEEGIVLGVQGVFDKFDIYFKKLKNQIILKSVS